MRVMEGQGGRLADHPKLGIGRREEVGRGEGGGRGGRRDDEVRGVASGTGRVEFAGGGDAPQALVAGEGGGEGGAGRARNVLVAVAAHELRHEDGHVRILQGVQQTFDAATRLQRHCRAKGVNNVMSKVIFATCEVKG